MSCGLTDCIGGTVQTHLTADNGQSRSRSIIENDGCGRTRRGEGAGVEASDFEIRYFCSAVQKPSQLPRHRGTSVNLLNDDDSFVASTTPLSLSSSSVGPFVSPRSSMKFQSIVLDIQVLIVIPGRSGAGQPSLSLSLSLSHFSSLFTALAVFHGGEHNGSQWRGRTTGGACATATAAARRCCHRVVITLEMDEVSGDGAAGEEVLVRGREGGKGRESVV